MSNADELIRKSRKLVEKTKKTNELTRNLTADEELIGFTKTVAEEYKKNVEEEIKLSEIPQGHGSDLDADTVDGLHASEIIAKRPFTSVGGGGGGERGPKGDKGDTGPQGLPGEAFANIDGGTPNSTYGGISPIDGGGA